MNGRHCLLIGALFLIFLWPPFALRAQIGPKADSFDIKSYIYIDTTITITARKALDLDDFLRLVQSDESLYQAFRNLRFETYDFETRFEMRKRSGEIKAEYYSLCRQQYYNHCRTMDMVTEAVRGNFFKNRKKRNYRYYTMDMYDRLFYTHGEVCGEKRLDGFEDNTGGDLSGMEKYIHELKKLVFSPGKPTSIPFIGDKTAIFSEEMAPWYNYRLSQTDDHYIFTAEVKDRYSHRDGKTVIRYFSTYFSKGDLQVSGRKYRLHFETLVYRFDVEMSIELKQLANGDYVPSMLTYNGYWNIPLKTIEIGSFQTRFYNFGL